ncbi:MAG TPA: glycosyltransferase family 39 protein [Candidatus Polarisedimenticolaceae bacterium]|nr:glycosyltransferase family 39 protein [Candidatus Polarisedimenticolaceae bacterium]
MTWGRAAVLAAAVLFFLQLGQRDLWAPDEPYFAEGAREMVVDGHWAVPHVNGVVTTDKPPLFFWSIAAVSLPGGKVTPWTARVPSALAGLATVLLVLRLGGGPAALVLATTYLFWDKARSAQIDALLTLLIAVALSAFWGWRSGSTGGRRAGLLFWGACGLAVLAKGPVGVMLPLGVALAFLAWEGDLRSWRRFAPVAGPLLLLALCGTWAAWASSRPEYSVIGALREHFVNRAMHGMHHKQPPWYYLGALPPGLFPWTGLLPGALVLAWRRRGDPFARFLFVWFVFIVLFFSISTEKRNLYVLPAYPACAILVARLLDAAERGLLSRRWVTLPLALTGALTVLVGAALPFLGERAPVPLPLVPLAVGTVLGGAAVAIAAFRSVRTAALTAAVAFGGIFLAGVLLVEPGLEPIKSARPFSKELAALTAPARAQGTPVLAFRLANLPEAFSYYTDGVYTVETWDEAALRAHLARPGTPWAAVNMDALPSDLRDAVVVQARAELSRLRVGLIRPRR